MDRLEAGRRNRWDRPTPCPDWDVRALVNHIVYEDCGPSPHGGCHHRGGRRPLRGDVLGDDLVTAARALDAATVATASGVVAGRTVHLSFGDTPATEYAYQLAADHIIHGWDLAAATGGDRTIDPELVEALAAWFADRQEAYLSVGAIAAPPADPDSAPDPQSRLLLAFGRDPGWSPAPAGAMVGAPGAAATLEPVRTVSRLRARGDLLVPGPRPPPASRPRHADRHVAGRRRGARRPRRAVELRFDEPVETVEDAVRVFGPDGQRVDTGTVKTADGGATLRAAVEGDAEGTYTVAWRVTSEDSHTRRACSCTTSAPARGRSTWPATAATPRRRSSEGAGRWLGFAGALARSGGAVALLLAPRRRPAALAGATPGRSHDPGGRDPARRPGARGTGASTACGRSPWWLRWPGRWARRPLVAMVAESAGRGVTTPSPWSATSPPTPAPAGWPWPASASPWWRRRRRLRRLAPVPAARDGGVGRGAGDGDPGRPRLDRPDRWVAVAADLAHLGAVAVWTGGLLALLVALPALADGAGRARLATRFSAVALAPSRWWPSAARVRLAAGAHARCPRQHRLRPAAAGQGGRLRRAGRAGVAQPQPAGPAGGAHGGTAHPLAAGRGGRRRRGAGPDRGADPPGARPGHGDRAVPDDRLRRGRDPRPDRRPGHGRPQRPPPVLPGRRRAAPLAVDAVQVTASTGGVPARRLPATPVSTNHVTVAGASLPSAGTWTIEVTAVRAGVPLVFRSEVPIR